jgi:hypothetical protein
MERKPGASVIGAVVDANQDYFVGLLLREVIPPMPRLELDRRCFATDMPINQIAGN